MIRLKTVVVVAVMLTNYGLVFALTDTRCPTACPNYCAVSVGGAAPPMCSDRQAGFASSHKATAEIERVCFTGELGPALFEVADDEVYCHELLAPAGDGGDPSNASLEGDCPVDGWRPADCP